MTATDNTIARSVLNMPTQKRSNPAVRYKSSLGWTSIHWDAYYKKIEAIGGALMRFGVHQGDRVAIMSSTRWEWGVLDLAALSVGAVTVPVYHNNSPEDVEFILNNSGSKIFICENKATYRLWSSIKDRCPQIEQVIVIENFTSDPKDFFLFEEFITAGQDFLKDDPEAFKNVAATITAQQMASILYTSGTTGKPKGVVLLHSAIISEVSEAFPLCGVTSADETLAFLPFAHVMGRIELWGHAFIGYTVNYAESIEKLRDNLAEIKPTLLVCVPRIFEKIYSSILAQIETKPLKAKIFKLALEVGHQVSDLRLTKQTIPLPLLLQYEVAKKMVLGKIQAAFGGRLRFAISGGAPIHADITKFFHAANVLVLEGYGLTETTAAITVNTPFNYRFGSVGRPIGDVQIKIAEDGEILVKSKKVMKEYYRLPEATQEALTDGWFHTGDIGEILPSGDLKITDRKKDLIKTAGGKYVAPQRLEGLLKINPLISQVVIHGDQKKYIIALLTLDKNVLIQIAQAKGLNYSEWTELCSKNEIINEVKRIVSETNAHLASFETIKKFKILPIEFSVEGGELTPSLKVKRKVLETRYKEEIESLYY